MTFFISSEYQDISDISQNGKGEHSDLSSDSPPELPQEYLPEMRGVSKAFKEALLSLDGMTLAPLINPSGALSKIKWPNNITRQDILMQAEEIWKVSKQCCLTFLDAAATALRVLSKRGFNEWVSLGLQILNSNGVSVELCMTYFQLSPELMKMGATHFITGWVEQILVISESSSKTALSFLCATPAFVRSDRAFHLRKWGKKVRQILEAGKNSEAAAIAFIETSTRIVKQLTFKELNYWGEIGAKIMMRCPDSALIYFSAPPESLLSLYNLEICKVLDLTNLLVDADLDRAMDFYQECPDALSGLNPNIRKQVLDASNRLAAERPNHIFDVFCVIESVLRPLFFPVQEKVMAGGDVIGSLSFAASKAYFKHVGIVLDEISDIFLSKWIEQGLLCLSDSEIRGLKYFSLKSEESRFELIKWKEAVLLEHHEQTLSVFAHAISGSALRIKRLQRLDSKKSELPRRYLKMQGKTLSLPSFIAEAPDRKGNYRLYKLIIAHHAGYLAFGTFVPLFPKIVLLLKSFPLNQLARDLFFLMEDGRINFTLGQEYAGLKIEINEAVNEWLNTRPSLKGTSLEIALEILLRLTLNCLDTEIIPQHMRNWSNRLLISMDGFFQKALSVWDSFQKAAELYELFSPLAKKGLNLPVAPLPFRGRTLLDFFSDKKTGAFSSKESNGDEFDTESAIHAMDEQDIKRLLEKMKDPKQLQNLKEEVAGEGCFIPYKDSISPMEPPEGQGDDVSGGSHRPVISKAGHHESKGPFYYDEWDYQKMAYRSNWCMLWEKPSPENDSGIFEKIHENYSDLILKVKKQFQRIRPETLEFVRRVEWGPEIDYNAMIQSVVDRKTGDSPSEKIFTRMEKKIRRISTILLVDMSASTDRAVSLVNPGENHHERNAHQSKAAVLSQEKKIIDVEIEALVVITEALQAMGDDYGIFGFSGYGREHVDFYFIKDFLEPYSERIKNRICGIQPQKGTRMGPAIRHAVEKLNQTESDQRLLVLLSDGFPQDLDYGEDRSSKDYALNDTMMALAEARKCGIRPFCITVDLAGDDYLRKMCDPGSYLIVKNVYSLPEVLPKVIESLVL